MQVPDSAGTATAFMTGVKSNFGKFFPGYKKMEQSGNEGCFATDFE